MKYYPPFGSTDPDAHYVDRNTAGAQRGSAIPAQMPEMTQREIVSVISGSGIDPTDDLQLAQAIQSQKMNYAVAGGTANALTATLVPAPAALMVGTVIRILMSASNTGPATLNVNGKGAIPILTSKGLPLRAGDQSVGRVVEFVYTGIAWQMLSPETGIGFTNLVQISQSGNWVVPDGIYLIRVWLLGSGGGGGSSSNSDPAAGGGGGPCGMKTIRTVPGTVFPIVLGAGGASGSSQNEGGTGGNTTGFGMSITGSTGGKGAATAIGARSSGVSGTCTGADIVFPGQAGGLATSQSSTGVGGMGGMSGGPFAGRPGINGASTGGFPSGYGSGGGGAGFSIAVGGQGAQGAAWVEY